jgi:hypothetical protein
MGWQWQMGSRCAEDLGEVRLNIADGLQATGAT